MSFIRRIRRVLKRRSPPELAVLVADRLVRRSGFSLLSFTRYGAIPPSEGSSADEIFEKTARDNLWGSAESISGGGSEIAMTAGYRGQLARLLPRFKSMFDAPCGDMNWMPLVLAEAPIEYQGGDISPHVIELNRSRFPDLRFSQFDITKDDFPEAEVWHCRDCWFHLSYEDIGKALRNFLKSDTPFALLTTHRGVIRNVDNPTGGWRYLDLTRPPFNFPEPELMMRDHLPGELPRYVALWRRDALAAANTQLA